MSIPINIEILKEALASIKKTYKPRGKRPGRTDDPVLDFDLVLRIVRRMNDSRFQNFRFHSALEEAAAIECGPKFPIGLKAVARKVVALYGYNMRIAGARGPRTPTDGRKKIGANVVISFSHDAKGQMDFLAERR